MIRKKLLMVTATCMFAVPSFAQVLELCARGTWNSTWLANANISNDGDKQDPELGWGYNYGGGLTFYFTKGIGVGADVLISKHNAAFSGTFAAPLSFTYTSKITMNTLNIPFMLKIKGDEGGGSFLELGGQYSMFKSVNYHSTVNGNSSGKDVKDKYVSSGISALLGMGINLKLNDRWGIHTGLRFEYCFTDVKGVDGVGRDLSDSAMYPAIYDKYESSHPFAGGIFLGLAYSIGDVD